MMGAVASPHLIDYIMESGKAGGACINVRTAVYVVAHKYTQIQYCHRITFISLKYLVRLSEHLLLISQFVSKQKDNSFAKIHLYNGWKEIASTAQGPIVADEQWV